MVRRRSIAAHPSSAASDPFISAEGVNLDSSQLEVTGDDTLSAPAQEESYRSPGAGRTQVRRAQSLPRRLSRAWEVPHSTDSSWGGVASDSGVSETCCKSLGKRAVLPCTGIAGVQGRCRDCSGFYSRVEGGLNATLAQNPLDRSRAGCSGGHRGPRRRVWRRWWWWRLLVAALRASGGVNVLVPLSTRHSPSKVVRSGAAPCA
jgi:hypothetical protein